MIGPDTYCECIESKLPKLATYTSVKAKNMDPVTMDQFKMSNHSLKDLFTSAVSREDTYRSLKSFGLTETEVEMMMAHYFDNMTFDEIAQQYGWTSRQSVSQHHQKILKNLRKAKFYL